MFDRFLEVYGAAFTTSLETTRSFFSLLVERLRETRGEPNIPHLAYITVDFETQRVLALTDFQKAIEIATAGFDLIRYLRAYETEPCLQYGFQLGLLLGDQYSRLARNDSPGAQLLELSKVVLSEVIQLCRTKELKLDTVDIEELS